MALDVENRFLSCSKSHAMRSGPAGRCQGSDEAEGEKEGKGSKPWLMENDISFLSFFLSGLRFCGCAVEHGS